MKKVFFLIAIGCFAFFKINAQTVDVNFVDGVIFMKFTDDYPLHFKVNEDRTVDYTQFPFLVPIFEKYDVIGAAQSLYLFDDPKLLRTLSVGFNDIYAVNDFIKELSLLPEIEYAEKISIKRKLYTPNDPYYGTLNNFNVKWHLDKISASAAWDLQQGSANIKVAVVDDAVWGEHPDLQLSGSNLCKVYGSYNPSYSTGTVTAANPPSSVNQNTNCSNLNNCASYEWSHGTHCAGAVGAKNNNGVGIASIGGGVTVMGIRTADDNSYLIYTLYGVQWAADNGAKVISMSYGSYSQDQTEKNVLQTCYNNGIILVAAAGNEGDAGNAINYPGGYNTVISVASIDNNGRLSDFSQYGPGRADIAAPGGIYSSTGYQIFNNILSTTYCTTQYWRYYGNYYGFTPPVSGVYYDGMEGTSMATPIVAGLCGLLASAYPSITPAQAKNCLQSTANSLASGSHTIDGNGYINARAAVQCAIELGGGSVTPIEECDEIDNILDDDTPKTLFAQDHTNSIYNYAEYFSSSGTVLLDTLHFYSYKAKSNNPNNSTINVKIYSESGGLPNSVLSSRTLTYSQLSDNGWNTITYSTPINITGNFFTVFELNSSPTTDTLALLLMGSDGRPESSNTSYVYYDNSWYKINDLFINPNTQESIIGSFYVVAYVCPQGGGTSTETCNAPTNLTATPNHNLGRIVLNWNAVSGAQSYIVYRNGTQLASGINNTTYTDMTATVGVTYSYTVKAVCTSGLSPASNAATAKLNSPAGINELSPTAISIYPNPAQNVINVELMTTLIDKIEITDLIGRNVGQYERIGTYKYAVPLNHLSESVYFIKVVTVDGEVHVSKFIKQ